MNIKLKKNEICLKADKKGNIEVYIQDKKLINKKVLKSILKEIKLLEEDFEDFVNNYENSNIKKSK